MGTDPEGQRTELVRRIDLRLEEFLADEHARWSGVAGRGSVVVDAVSGLVWAGGKRLRPTFCVTGFLAAGGDPADLRIVDCAAAIELVHTGALIHDDVLDAAETRRGSPAVHMRHIAEHRAHGWWGEPRRYGEGVAILAGDLATVYAARLIPSLPGPARAVWGDLLTEVQIGQFLDLAVAAESVVDAEMSRWVAVCKSGRYSIHRPLVLGAALAGRAVLGPAFAAYGESLGEAFQLRDDLIDAFGDSRAAGKPVGHDLEQHKMTLLLATAAERDRRVHDLVSKPDWDVPALRARLGEIGIEDVVEQRIAGLVADATGALEQTDLPAPWRAELTALARKVAYRDR